MIILADIIGLALLDGYRIRRIAGTDSNGAGVIAGDIVDRNNIGDLISRIDGVRAIDAKRI